MSDDGDDLSFDEDEAAKEMFERWERDYPHRAKTSPEPSQQPATLTTPEPPKGDAWPVMDEAAYHGLAGDFVRTVLPHTEADAAGLLMQFLVAFGSVIGNSPYYLVESDKHHANIYLVLVGESSRGRKGTGAGRVREASRTADETWAGERNVSGLSSGEGLISHVRDEVRKWNAKERCDEVVDPGITASGSVSEKMSARSVGPVVGKRRRLPLTSLAPSSL
jgi:hypothetical protein